MPGAMPWRTFVQMKLSFLSPEQHAGYERDGYLLIENFLSPDEVRRAKAGIDRECAARASMTKDADGFNLEKVGDDSMNADATAKGAGIFRKIQGAVFHVPEALEIFTSPKTVKCMRDIIGASVYLHSSKVMFKPANGGAAKPWHQDAAYWKNYEPKQVTVWLALDDATEENGCIWAIPGSHHLGLIPHVARELQVEESRIDMAKAVPVPVKPGGLLIFHSLVLHMSKKNTSDKNRCAIICDYDCSPNPCLDLGTRPSAFAHPTLRADGVWPLAEAAV